MGAAVRETVDRALKLLVAARAKSRAGAHDEAIEMAGKALEETLGARDEAEAAEAARAHFVYGECLFRGAQAQSTVFGEQVRANAEASGTRLEDGEKEDAEADEDVVEEEEEDAAADGDGDDANDANEEDEGDETDETDMELAWKMLETARVMYEEDCDGRFPLDLADVLETIGEFNMEQSQFEPALGDYKASLALLEANLDATDRRLASALYEISIASQMLEANDDALAANTRAIEICEARVAELKAGTARVSRGARERAGEPVSPEASIAELEEIMGVASDLKERQLELKELVSADNSTREALRQAFKAIGGAAPEGTAEPQESEGFAAPTLTSNVPVQAAPVRRVLPAPVKRVEVAPLREASAAKRVEPQQTVPPAAPEAKKLKPTPADKAALMGANNASTDAEPNGCPQQ